MHLLAIRATKLIPRLWLLVAHFRWNSEAQKTTFSQEKMTLEFFKNAPFGRVFQEKLRFFGFVLGSFRAKSIFWACSTPWIKLWDTVENFRFVLGQGTELLEHLEKPLVL